MTQKQLLPSLLVLVLLLYCQIPAVAQYKFSPEKDMFLFTVGVRLTTEGFYRTDRVPSLSYTEWIRLDRDNVNSFDRCATRFSSNFANKSSDYLVAYSIALPFVFLANPQSKNKLGGISILVAQSLAFTMSVTNITKGLVQRKRPYTYNCDAFNFDFIEKAGSNARVSFFSGHTSASACMTFLSARMHDEYFPKSKSKGWVWATAATIPAVTGFLRVAAGKHYPSDVIVGYVVGAVIGGLLIPNLHK